MIPLLWWYLRFRRRQRQVWAQLGEPSLLSRLSRPLQGRSQARRFALLLFAFVALVMALANPQIGRRYERVKQRGVDIVVALDVSQSMLAEDEQPNRLARGKLLVNRLLDRLQGDRFGLILFAGDAFVMVPLTGDYAATRSILQTVSPDLIPRQGTALGRAIELAAEAFPAEQQGFRTLIMVTDGEDHEGAVMEQAAAAREKGLRVHTVGIGSPGGATIPVFRNGEKVSEKRDRQGQIVRSTLDPQMLSAIAEAGGGRYWPLDDIRSTVDGLEDALDRMTQQDFDERFVTDYEDQFPWMLGLALVLLLLEWGISLLKPVKG